MAEQIKINKKCINDPLYTPVERFLKERIKRLEAEGPEDELALAKERYTGLVAGDLVIENPVAFPDGITRVCFTARKTGFARVDVDITRVQMKDILEDFAVPMIEIEDLDNLKAYVKANKVDHALLWCKWLNNYGVLLSQEEAKTINGPMAAFGDLFFNEYVTSRESLTFIDYDTLESGTVKISDASFGTGTYPLFIYELVLDEANVPGITSNLPESITTQRGKDFSIPNTYWFNTTIDITHEAEIEISTGSGYTIPKRSDDGNFIVGETIYGAADKEVHDEIIVRVTYMWQGRPVKKTFRINVIIEKDNTFDLTFEIDPPTVTAPSGSDVQVKITAYYKGEKVKITVPPTQLLQQGNFGPMNFTDWDENDAMIYEGHLSTNFPNTVEQVGGLYTAEFVYNEGDITSRAPAYVNVILTRPESAPKFEIRSFPAVIRGFKGDKGLLTVGAFYNNEPISPTDLDIRTGKKGEKQLIEYDSVDQLGVNYTIINDANKPGQEITDDYDQVFRWIAPTGVRYTLTRHVTVIVKQVSTVEVVPVLSNPLTVTKYQFGSYPFKLIVNGNDVTKSVSDYTFEDEKGFIIPKKGDPNQWFVGSAPDIPAPDESTTVPFKFRYTIDGVWREFTYEQSFIVKAWEQDPGTTEPGINTKTVAVPSSAKIEGLSDETGYFEFQVYHLSEDITATAEIMKDKLVTPAGIVFNSFVYIEERNVIRANYSKLEPTTEPGKVYIQRPGIEDPKPEDIALVHVTTDVKQSRVLVLKDFDKDTTVEVAGSPKLAKITLTFAGQVVSLNDPNLSYKRTDKTDVRIVDVQDDGVEVVNNVWAYIGETRQYGVELEYIYTDPRDGKQTSVKFTLPVFTVYPEMRLEGTPAEPIDAAIWDTGLLPFTLMAGNTNWTGAITSVKSVQSNKYIAFNKLNWEVIWAEKEASTITIPLEIKWTVGNAKDRKFVTEVVFNLAPWDQITFGGEWDPKSIKAESRTNGKITGNFVYKGQPANGDVVVDKAASTIPETFIMGVSSNVDGEGVVIGYETTRGGDYLMTLVYRHTPSGMTINADIPTEIAWPHELNLVKITPSIKGVWENEATIDLVYNWDGIPLTLNDPDLKLTATSGTGEPVELVKINDESLTIKLAKGGEKGEDYNYDFKIHVEYLDPNGKTWTNDNTVPVTIHIPDVRIGSNPSFNVKVWDRGVLGIKLVDDQGRNVPIESLSARGTNPYITFTQPDNWYVIAGSQSTSISTTLRLTAQFSMGGNTYQMDVDTDFNIEKYDGKKFVIVSGPEEVKGKAGTPGVMKFRFTYAGDEAKNMTIDLAKSVIPKNITLGEITPDGDVPYTLLGQAVDNLSLVFVRENATNPPVLNDDYVVASVKVTTESSDEVFTVESKTPSLSLPWMDSGTVVLALKYGEYAIPGNTPGLKYSLVDNGKPHGITIVGGTSNGVIVRATRSDVSEAVTVYPEDILVSYEVGAPSPKEGTISTEVTITMGKATVTNNQVVNGKIWDTGSFSQGVAMGDVNLSGALSYKFTDGENEWVEFITPRGWEIIGAEPQTSNKKIPMQLTYKVDATPDIQTLDFEAEFKISGSSNTTRFTCVVRPAILEGAVEVQNELRVRPIYKGKDAGATAKFKPELSTFPKSVKYIGSKVDGAEYVLTFEGVEAGLDEMTLVFWSPDAGNDPKPRDVWEGKVTTKIMGELGIEIGDRDNLLIGKDGDTGIYKLQILFGGIPIDTKESIDSGALKMSVATATGSQPGAGVLGVTDYYSDGFVYALKGVVAPGRTINVSDFIDIYYTYGGQTFNRRVEIPEQYTSADVVIVPVTPKNCKMFEVGQIGIVSAKCGELNLLTGTLPPPAESGWINCQIDEEEPNGYITVAKTNFTVVNADVEAKSITLKMIYNGIYRNWTWQGKAEVTFNITAWDQKTFFARFMSGNPSKPLSGDRLAFKIEMPIPAGSALFDMQTVFKDKISFIGTDTIDYLDTDFKGALDLTSMGPIGTNGNADYRNRYYGDPLKEFKDEIKLIFRVPGSPKPGVENLDWTALYLDCDFTYKPLTVSPGNQNLKGGNGDKGNLPVTVRLNTTNINLTDPNLKVTMDPDDILKLSAGTNTYYSYEVIAPLDAELGPRTIKMMFEYTDPNTGNVHKGQYVQNFEITKPSDYPVIKPITLSISPFIRVKGSQIFTITSGGNNIITQCKPVSMQILEEAAEGTLIIPDDENPNNDWLWCIDYFKGNPPSHSVKTSWVIEVPFRGSTIQIPDVELNVLVASSLTPKPWIEGTAAPNPFELTPGKEGEIRFKMTKRGLPTTDLVLNQEATQNGTFFEVLSVEPDGEELVVKYKGLNSFFAKFNFTWDVPDYDGTNDPHQRGKVPLNAFQGPEVTPTQEPRDVVIWEIFSPFKVTTGTTDITNQCSIVKVEPESFATATLNGTVQCVKAATEDQTLELKVTYKLPTSMGGGEITGTNTVNVKGWDGVEFWHEPGQYMTVVDDKTIVQIPFTNNFYEVTVAAMMRSKRYPNKIPSNVSSSSEFSKIDSVEPGVVELAGKLSDGAKVVARVVGKKVGRFPGTMSLVYKGVAADGDRPNGYPVGTEGKNLDTIDVEWYVHEDKLTFREGFVPEPIIVPAGSTTVVDVPCDIVWGMIPVHLNLTNEVTSVSLTHDTGIATLFGATNVQGTNRFNWTATSYKISPASVKVGATDVVSYFTFNIVFHNAANNKNYTFSYDQPIIFKGKEGGTDPVLTVTDVQEVNTSVWKKNTGLPFKLAIDGTNYPIDTSTVTNIKVADKDKDWLEMGPKLTDGYIVIAGEPEATTKTGTFIVTVIQGPRVWEIEQDIVFNIEGYDGQALTFKFNNPSPINNGILAQASTIYRGTVSGEYRKAAIVDYSLFEIDDARSKLPGFAEKIYNQGPDNNSKNIYFNWQALASDMEEPQEGYLCVGLKSRMYLPDAVEGVDFTYVKLPVQTFFTDKYYLVSADPVEFKGQFGGPDFNMLLKIRKGANLIGNLNAEFGVNGVAFAPPIVKVVSVAASGFSFALAGDIDVGEKTTEVLNTWVKPGVSSTLAAKVPITVTQVSTVPKPTVTDLQSEITIHYGESGGLPFRLDWKGTDVTDQITEMRISDNSYIEIRDDKWYVKHADVQTVKVMPTFEVDITLDNVKFTVKQEVTFTVYGYNGKRINATAEDLVLMTGEAGYITIKGDYSGEPLVGNVVFDAKDSMDNGWVTFGAMEPGSNGTLVIKVTGKTVGEGFVKIRLRSVHDTGNGNIGSDFIDLRPNVEILPTELTPAANFQTTGSGNFFELPTLIQSVLLGSKALANTDENLIIQIVEYPAVTIETLSDKTIGYKFSEDSDTEIVHKFKLKFTYKGRSEYVVDITLTQEASPTTPYVADITQIDVEYGKSYKVPFKVISPR